MKSLEQRLARLAQALECYPVHGILFTCVSSYERTGTSEELQEVSALSDRLDPYLTHLQPTGLMCHNCGERLWCRQCYKPLTKHIVLPDDLMTEAETARYLELIALLIERSEHPGPLGCDRPLHWCDVSRWEDV
jgi:hypothetical protein